MCRRSWLRRSSCCCSFMRYACGSSAKRRTRSFSLFLHSFRRAMTPVWAGSFPGGFGADLWTFFSYAFIHANLLHIGLNLAWLLPFGTALARRFGAVRYCAFMLVTSAAGALAYLVSSPEQMAPMIGASAAISGAMAAAMRFVFQRGGLLGLSDEAGAHRVPARPLFATLTDVRFLMFLVVWLGLNMLFGLGTVSIGGGRRGDRLAGAYRRLFCRPDPVRRF